CPRFGKLSLRAVLRGKQSGRLDLNSRREGWLIEHGPQWDVISPDKRLTARGSQEGQVRLALAESGKEVAVLTCRERGRLTHLAYSPDGTPLLALGQESKTLYVFALRRIREQLAGLGLDWAPAPSPSAGPGGDPALIPPLRVELIEPGVVASAVAMAEYES